ncbi:MAG: YjgP/YjgQ family permease [Lentisphaerae bacterium]|jgi:LPS export ABC transporter permease LptG|nr:YjgP/YjgQ family permease [Lentisphaerota bacterium]
MRIIRHHILKSFLQPLVYCLVTFIALYIIAELVDVFSDITTAKPSPFTIIRYFAGFIAPYFDWLMAAALLLASLYTMWQLCRHSEVIAMRASGISIFTIAGPMTTIAILCSVIGMLSAEFFSPAAAEFSKQLKKRQFLSATSDIRENVNYYSVAGRRIWRINKIDLYRPDTLLGVQITCERPNGSREVVISCKRVEYLDGTWWLHYPQYTWYDEMGIPCQPAAPELKSLTMRVMPNFTETPYDFVNETRDWTFLPIRARLRYLQTHPDLSQSERNEEWYDIHNRLASPWTGLVITLFAIPMGIATGRQSVAKGIIAALALFFTFFATVNGGMILAKRELIPAVVGAWGPHFIFLVTGLTLLWRQR